MAYKKNTTNKKNDDFAPVDVGEGFFLHYRENDYGLFSLERNGAIIYGCRLVNGSAGTFVSYPARKGKDDRYYNHARFTDPIPDKVVENIANAIGF